MRPERNRLHFNLADLTDRLVIGAIADGLSIPEAPEIPTSQAEWDLLATIDDLPDGGQTVSLSASEARIAEKAIERLRQNPNGYGAWRRHASKENDERVFALLPEFSRFAIMSAFDPEQMARNAAEAANVLRDEYRKVKRQITSDPKLSILDRDNPTVSRLYEVQDQLGVAMDMAGAFFGPETYSRTRPDYL